jgi:hypothetical protein
MAGVPAVSDAETQPRRVEVVDPDPGATGERYYRIVTPGVVRE